MSSNLTHDLTFLVSCYNKINYIDRFLKNSQTATELGFRLLIIDDGSTDGSSQKLSEGVVNFTNTDLILRKNMGSGFTRNELLNLARTRYVFFWDIDDLVNLESISVGIQSAVAEDADLCVAAFQNYKTGEVFVLNSVSDVRQTFQIQEVREDIWRNLGYSRYIYKREWLSANGIGFFPTYEELSGRYFIFDDVFWVSNVASCDGTIVIMPKDTIFYYYDAPDFDPDAQFRFKQQLGLVPQLIFIYCYRNALVNLKVFYNHMNFLSEYLFFAVSNMFSKRLLSNSLIFIRYMILLSARRIPLLIIRQLAQSFCAGCLLNLRMTTRNLLNSKVLEK